MPAGRAGALRVADGLLRNVHCAGRADLPRSLAAYRGVRVRVRRRGENELRWTSDESAAQPRLTPANRVRVYYLLTHCGTTHPIKYDNY